MGRPLDLEDLVLVRLKAVELELEIAQVPERDRLVGTSRGQDELTVRVEAQAVDLQDNDNVRAKLESKYLNVDMKISNFRSILIILKTGKIK